MTRWLSPRTILQAPYRAWLLLGLLAFLLGGLTVVAGLAWAGMLSFTPAPGHARLAEQSGAASKEASNEVRFPESKWERAGLKIQPARYAPLEEHLWRTGRLAVNEDKLAHLTTLLDGTVREVKAQLGQEVKAGAVLAILECKDVGQARLELARSRLALTAARTQHEWVQTSTRNAAALLDALAKNPALEDLEKQFQGKPIGEWRQQLVSAYARRLQLRSRLDAQMQLENSGAVGRSTLRSIQAEYDGAVAAYDGLREEVRFQVQQQARTSEQKVRDAEAAVSLVTAQLQMLGFSRTEVEKMDPLAEGESVAHFPIRAPFAGTIINRHAVQQERVGAQHQLFELSDLSLLWVHVEVPEADAAWLEGLKGQQVQFRLPGRDGSLQQAEVFYTGDQVDKATRTISLLAQVPNPRRLLLPGMFVEVQLTRRSHEPVVQIPTSAVQRIGNQVFVFSHRSGEQFMRQEIRLGRSAAEWVEVQGGLTAGQPIAIEGAFALKSELLRSTLSGD